MPIFSERAYPYRVQFMESNYPSLYKNCLVEYDPTKEEPSDFKERGLIRCTDRLYLSIDHIRYQIIHEVEKNGSFLFDPNENENDKNANNEDHQEINDTEIFTGTAIIGVDKNSMRDTISIFGTDRCIEAIDIRIKRSSSEREFCTCTAIMENEDFEFPSQEGLYISLYIRDEFFNHIKLLNDQESIHKIQIMLQLLHINGFYSKWNPTISRSRDIKILAETDIVSNKDVLPENFGHVNSSSLEVFSISVQTKTRSLSVPDSQTALRFTSTFDSSHNDGRASPWNKMKKRALEQSSMLGSDIDEDCKRSEMQSQYMRIHETLIEEGIKSANRQGYEPNSDHAWEIVEEAMEVANALASPLLDWKIGWFDDEAVTVEKIRDQLQLTSLIRERDLLENAKNGKPIYMILDQFNYAIEKYLSCQFKNPQIDRFIVTALVQNEVQQYLEEQTRTVPFFQPKSRIDTIAAQRITIGKWLRGRIIDLLYAISAIAIAAAVHVFLEVSQDVVIWTAVVCAVLYSIIFVVTLIALPQGIRSSNQATERYTDLIKEMVQVYGEVPPTGAISVQRLREQAEQAAAAGAAWPSSLWAVLDDARARGEIVL